MADIQVSVLDTDDGKALVVTVPLNHPGALQIADLLTRPAAATADDIRARVTPTRRLPTRKRATR